ncbi:MAG: RluA family pseudouridine synthase [Bacteroidales bacterium]|nr:RluA family pseudouridine synthase [Bacteroidales bacterium]
MSIELEKQILFEDNHLIIINKRSSQIVHSDKTGDVSLEEMVKHYLKTKYNKPGNVYCGLVHRLDRPVSGVVMFAKTEKALVRLNKMMKEHQIHKTYWAIVRNNNIKPKATLVNFLIRNEKQNKTYVTKDTNKGKYAELDYEVLKKSDNYQLLKVNLKTGRHHQIRVQLSNIGCPIKGDLKYGFERSNKDASISLHARELEFLHPVKKEQIKIIAPLPKDSLWQWFDENISKE